MVALPVKHDGSMSAVHMCACVRARVCVCVREGEMGDASLLSHFLRATAIVCRMVLSSELTQGCVKMNVHFSPNWNEEKLPIMEMHRQLWPSPGPLPHPPAPIQK